MSNTNHEDKVASAKRILSLSQAIWNTIKNETDEKLETSEVLTALSYVSGSVVAELERRENLNGEIVDSFVSAVTASADFYKDRKINN